MEVKFDSTIRNGTELKELAAGDCFMLSGGHVVYMKTADYVYACREIRVVNLHNGNMYGYPPEKLVWPTQVTAHVG